MKAAIYNRFLHSMGGGERHSSMLAQVLAEEGHEVDLIGHEDVGKDVLADHLGLDLAKVSLRVVPAIYQTIGMLLAAYAIMFLPRAMVSLRAAMSQAPPVLDDVAHALGAGPTATFRRVTLPLIAPGLGAGAALVFLAVTTELTATLLLAPIGTQTLATQFWSNSTSIAYGAAAPYAALIVLISLPATFLLTREARRSTTE